MLTKLEIIHITIKVFRCSFVIFIKTRNLEFRWLIFWDRLNKTIFHLNCNDVKNSRTILTAAHCLCAFDDNYKKMPVEEIRCGLNKPNPQSLQDYFNQQHKDDTAKHEVKFFYFIAKQDIDNKDASRAAFENNPDARTVERAIVLDTIPKRNKVYFVREGGHDIGLIQMKAWPICSVGSIGTQSIRMHRKPIPE